MSKFRFEVGRKYARREIRGLIGMDPGAHGGKVDTGYFEHGTAFFILCGVGVPGRTGHDYKNHFEGSDLVRFGRTGTSMTQPQINALLKTETDVHVFFRRDERAPFGYLGLGAAVEVLSETPVRVTWTFLQKETRPIEAAAEEVSGRGYWEGAVQKALVNRYERNPAARAERIRLAGVDGLKCEVCKFDFLAKYGEIGREFIHVHHKVPLTTIRQGYELVPSKDLDLVCPNCHAMLHRKDPPLSAEELRQMLVTG